MIQPGPRRQSDFGIRHSRWLNFDSPIAARKDFVPFRSKMNAWLFFDMGTQLWIFECNQIVISSAYQKRNLPEALLRIRKTRRVCKKYILWFYSNFLWWQDWWLRIESCGKWYFFDLAYFKGECQLKWWVFGYFWLLALIRLAFIDHPL